MAADYLSEDKMKEITYTSFHRKLKYYLDEVRKSHMPLYVKSPNGGDVVILSKSDYESMMETLFLIKSPSNGIRLLNGIKDYEMGLGAERNLIEE